MSDKVAIVLIKCGFIFIGLILLTTIGDPDILNEIINILHAYARGLAK